MMHSLKWCVMSFLFSFACVAVAVPLMLNNAFAQATAPDAAPVKEVIPEPARPERIFAHDSFWYQPIPDDAPLHPNSANFVAEFLRQKKAYYGTVSINTKAYAAPVYIVGPDVKPIPVTEWDCQKKALKTRF